MNKWREVSASIGLDGGKKQVIREPSRHTHDVYSLCCHFASNGESELRATKQLAAVTGL
jgi:hypothetical protein